MPSITGALVPGAATLCRRMTPWTRIEQDFPANAAADPLGALRRGIDNSPSVAALPAGTPVALAVGSRGIARLPELVRTAVEALRQRGLQPFIVTAMGSHGGATAEGQRDALTALGVTAEAVGAEIRATMDTVEVGNLDGIAIHTDRYAVEEAGAIIPLARVKPHTDFRGPIQSGVLKMLSIGLGNRAAADALHSVSPDDFSACIDAVGTYLLNRLPVPCGIAVVEDAHEQLGRVEVIDAADIPSRERDLLKLATQWLPRLPFDALDVLVVQQMGKNIAGTGMDPNVTGRFYQPRAGAKPAVRCLITLGLTEQTHGNATGIGMADITTRRVAESIDWHATYVNEITARMLPGAKTPIVAADDQEAIAIALYALGNTAPEDATIAYITDTLHVAHFYASTALARQLADRPGLRVTDVAVAPYFDTAGNLTLRDMKGRAT